MLFLVVGLAVLILRVSDPNAWLLALLFGGFIAVPPFPGFERTFAPSIARMAPALGTFAMGYRAVFQGLFAGLFYLFFAVFPTRL